jgi:hypothetical protein
MLSSVSNSYVWDHILPVRTFTHKERAAIRDSPTPGGRNKLRADRSEVIKNLRPDRPSVRHIVYLLRGLLVNRVLIMTLKKRWNVQYRNDGNSVYEDRQEVDCSW